MLHINVFNVFIARPTQKTKTTPNPSPRASAASIAAHSVCGPSLVQSIKRYQQPVTKSAVHPAGPVTPYQHSSPSHPRSTHCLRTFLLSRGGIKLLRSSLHNYNYSSKVYKDLSFLPLTPAHPAPLWQFQL